MTSQLTNLKKEQSQIASLQDMTMASLQEDKKEVVSARGFRGKAIELDVKKAEVAHSILANKIKGTSNLGENFIVEGNNFSNGL